MDLLKDKLSKVYFKFLLTAFGSALITSIYSLVDMIVVGKYHGPNGSAAMAVIAPIWNIIYSLGLLVGIGGSVLYSVQKGKKSKEKDSNQYFSSAIIFGIIIALLTWLFVILFEEPLLILFGADETLMPLCKSYFKAVKVSVPVFIFMQMIAAFLRNDGDPTLATIAVIFGGVFNVLGDYFLTFTCDLGIEGAGIATALGATVSLLIMSIHFFKKTNTLRFSFKKSYFSHFLTISKSGFSTFIIDIAMGVLTILINRQIMKYLNSDALAVYGVLINIGTFVQCCAYGVGQAAQPILSQNYGAKEQGRVKKLLVYNIYSCLVISAIWFASVMLFPNQFIHLFMNPTDSVLAIAPNIMRVYACAFLFLPFNVYSTYYFQAILRTKTSIIVSLARGIIISGLLILVLPLIFNGNSIWVAVPLSELITCIMVIIFILQKEKKAN